MARRKESLTLEEPRALRALAHPARQRLVSELFAGRVLTATEAAELVGLTPSAVSHHLRALERWGLVRRAHPRGDARERPWEATAKSLRLRPAPGEGGRAAMQSVLNVIVDEFAAQISDFIASIDDEPWAQAFQGLSRGELWLTRDEARELSEQVVDLIEALEKGRTAARHPKGARRATFTWSLVPLEPAPPDT
jgi:DNA-binding MarR family transcriptional regulator